MLKVNNQGVIRALARTTYLAHKKRNALTIIAIFLTTLLICTVISIGVSYWDTIAVRQQRMEGMDYDIDLTEPREDQVSAIRGMDSVKYAGLRVKCAVISRYEDIALDRVKLYWLDNICWEKQTVPALDHYEGTYPQEENEIMLSDSVLNAMGIKNPGPGMELSLGYLPLAENSEEEEIAKTFVLSGWFLDYTGADKGYVSEEFYRQTGARQTDMTQGELKISLANSLYSKNDITKMQNQINLSNQQIIRGDYDTISNFLKTGIGLFALLFLVFMSGYLFIYNTLYISINKDIRFYGQLKTIGTTSVQIKKMIYRQVVRSSAVGIALGLLSSAVIGKGIIPQVIHAFNPTIGAKEVEAVSLWAFAAAAVFSFATTLFSSQKPARMAMNCSPVEAAKYIGNTLSKANNKVRSGGGMRSMVWTNLFRDKKQFVVILCSLSLALSLFLIINVVISVNNAAGILNHIYEYDFRILNQTLLSDSEEQVITSDLIEKTERIEGVKDVRVLKATSAVVPYQEEVYGEYYKELYQSRYSPGNYEEDIGTYKKQPDNDLFDCRIVGIDDLEFERLNRELDIPLDKEAFDQGRTAFAARFTGLPEWEGYNAMVGKKVRFSIPKAYEPDKEETIEIGALITDNPAYYAAGYTPDLIVSDDYFEKLVRRPLIEMMKIDYEEPFSKSTEAAIKALIKDNRLVSAESKLDRYSEMKDSERRITVLGGSLGVIVLLLALSNYLNMMSASIQNRSREFAVLESIGMTRKQMRKMVVSENLCYAVCSIAAAVIAGLPVSRFVFENANIYGLPFVFPIARNLLLFFVIIAICVVSALILLRKTKNVSIIELLRQDEM